MNNKNGKVSVNEVKNEKKIRNEVKSWDEGMAGGLSHLQKSNPRGLEAIL